MKSDSIFKHFSNGLKGFKDDFKHNCIVRNISNS